MHCQFQPKKTKVAKAVLNVYVRGSKRRFTGPSSLTSSLTRRNALVLKVGVSIDNRRDNKSKESDRGGETAVRQTRQVPDHSLTETHSLNS